MSTIPAFSYSKSRTLALVVLLGAIWAQAVFGTTEKVLILNTGVSANSLFAVELFLVGLLAIGSARVSLIAATAFYLAALLNSLYLIQSGESCFCFGKGTPSAIALVVSMIVLLAIWTELVLSCRPRGQTRSSNRWRFGLKYYALLVAPLVFLGSLFWTRELAIPPGKAVYARSELLGKASSVAFEEFPIPLQQGHETWLVFLRPGCRICDSVRESKRYSELATATNGQILVTVWLDASDRWTMTSRSGDSETNAVKHWKRESAPYVKTPLVVRIEAGSVAEVIDADELSREWSNET